MSLLREFLVYALIDPTTKKIRYIGQSTRGLARPKEHWKPCKLRNAQPCHAVHWLKKLVHAGNVPTVYVLETCASQEELNAAEIHWIAFGRTNNWPLTNQTDGGLGQVGRIASDVTRKVVGSRYRGKKLTKKHRKALSTTLKGRIFSEETRKKISVAKTGKKFPPRSEEYRLKMSKVKKGAKFTQAHKDAIGRSKKGKKVSIETREKIRKALKGRRGFHHTLQTREKMSLSKLAYYRAKRNNPNGAGDEK